jgi:hypothetical protein
MLDESMKVIQAVDGTFPDRLEGTEVCVAGLPSRVRVTVQGVLVAGAVQRGPYVHGGVPVYLYPIPAKPTRAESRGLTAERGAERFCQWLGDNHPNTEVPVCSEPPGRMRMCTAQ